MLNSDPLLKNGYLLDSKETKGSSSISSVHLGAELLRFEAQLEQKGIKLKILN